MEPFRHIKVERRGEVFCVRLRHSRLEENEIYQFGEEVVTLCHRDGCRKLALSLGPGTPDCLYSVFLAKLVSLRNTLRKVEGQFVLCEVSPVARSVFEACLLHKEFDFVPDFAAAVAHFAAS